MDYPRHSSSAMASICPLLSAFRADLMVTSVSSQVMFLPLFEFPFHDLVSQRRPEGAVLDQADGAVLVVAFGQVIDKVLHERKMSAL